MTFRAWVSGLFLTILASSPAFPWGYEGHEMVGAIADQMLSDGRLEVSRGMTARGTSQRGVQAHAAAASV